MKNTKIALFILFIVLAGCSHSARMVDGPYQGSGPYHGGPGIIIGDPKIERNRMLKLYGAGDFDQIYSALRGYSSTGSHNFIGDLIYNHPAMSLCFAAVAIEKNDDVLFNDVLWIAQANERDPNALIQLGYMRQARQSCGYTVTEAMRVYFRNQRKSTAIRPLIGECPALEKIF